MKGVFVPVVCVRGYLPCGALAAIAFLATVHKIERSPASSAYSIRSSPRSSRINETMMLCMAGPSKSSRVVDWLVAIAEGLQCNGVAKRKDDVTRRARPDACRENVRKC